jgi:hypothetical protein
MKQKMKAYEQFWRKQGYLKLTFIRVCLFEQLCLKEIYELYTDIKQVTNMLNVDQRTKLIANAKEQGLM